MVKMLYEALIEVPKAYNNSIKLKSGKELFVESKTNNVRHTVRYGKVICPPMMIPNILEKGDTVFFHHNIVRESVDPKGKPIIGMFEYDKSKGLYRCPLDMIFAVVKEEKFEAVDPYCFVKPIAKKDLVSGSGLILKSVDEEREHLGIMKYSNNELRGDGIRENDVIIFSKDSEYEYHVYGEKLYRMHSNDILAKLKCVEWIGEKDLSNSQS